MPLVLFLKNIFPLDVVKHCKFTCYIFKTGIVRRDLGN